MSYIVVRKARPDSRERDEAYNFMFEGHPKTTLTLGTKVARMDRALAETCARQLRGMFPAHEWVAIPETEFKYKADPPAEARAQ